MIIVAFIAGLFVGGTLGIVTMALCVAAAQGDRDNER
ncbi:MAG TPA: DUF3789 domain-containing protein [Candidatus Binataceae bacterium]|nr:DUF3789 domain-containing protein [Candidatus Binataceae bacterium]